MYTELLSVKSFGSNNNLHLAMIKFRNEEKRSSERIMNLTKHLIICKK